jgi:hypothetical protein
MSGCQLSIREGELLEGGLGAPWDVRGIRRLRARLRGLPQWFRDPRAPSASGPTGRRFDARSACESTFRLGAHSDGLAAMPAPMIGTHMAADAPDRRSDGGVGRLIEGGCGRRVGYRTLVIQ